MIRELIITINFLLANADLLKISFFIFFDKTYLEKPECIMIENTSINKMYLQLRFVLKNKDLKSNIRISLKWILLNHLKWILDEFFRISCGRYQHTQLYLRAGFSLLVWASFFLIYAGDCAGMGDKIKHHAKVWYLLNMQLNFLNKNTV